MRVLPIPSSTAATASSSVSSDCSRSAFQVKNEVAVTATPRNWRVVPRVSVQTVASLAPRARMVEPLRRHTNPATRKQIWERLQKTWYEDAGSMKFGDYFEMHLHRRELKGFVENPTHTWYNAWLER